jgi:hypothetical protein
VLIRVRSLFRDHISTGSKRGQKLSKRLITAALLALAASPTWARVYYVSPSGNNANSGTSASSAWRSINYAISPSSPVAPGDEIQIAAGVYRENVDIKKSGTASLPITLRGVGEVIVNDPSPSAGTGEGVVEVLSANNIVIDNLAVENAYFFGFVVRGANNVVLRNVRTYLTGASGIIVATNKRSGVRSSNVKILNSEVQKSCYTFWKIGQGGHEAISLASVDGFEVGYTKVFDGKKEGITAKGSVRNGNIHHNTVSSIARAGIYVGGTGGDARNVSIANNLVYDNGHGIVVVNEGNGHTEAVTVTNNVVYSNAGRGIGVAPWGPGPDHDINDVKIVNNTVTKNGTIGILMDNAEATNVLVRNNVSYQNAVRDQIKVVAGQVVADRNLTTDPRFRNPSWSDYSLKSDSPAIDAGSSAYAPAMDYVGQRRPMGSGPDIGAYEVR